MRLVNDIKKKLKEDNSYNDLKDYLMLKNHLIKYALIATFMFLALLIFGFISYDKKYLNISKMQIVVIYLLSVLTLGFAIYSLIIIIKKYNYDKKLFAPFNLKKLLNHYSIFDVVTSFLLSMSVVLTLIGFVFSSVEVDGSSMENTLFASDRGLAYHLFYQVENDDIVIIDNSGLDYVNEQGKELLVKRVVASYEDEILINNYFELIVNGNKIETLNGINMVNDLLTYEGKSYFIDFNQKISIPKDTYIVLGDHRIVSKDSRYFGLINVKHIVGKYIFTFYPFKDFGIPKKQLDYEY